MTGEEPRSTEKDKTTNTFRYFRDLKAGETYSPQVIK